MSSDQNKIINTSPEDHSMSGSASSEKSTMEQPAKAVISEYINKRDTEKKNMIDKLSKQEMVNIIFKQNDLLAQQSSQMIEIIDMANNIEQSARSDEAAKCDVVKQQNDTCSHIASIQNRQVKMYENSVRIQIVLFILFVVLLAWLAYHFLSGSGFGDTISTSTTTTLTTASTPSSTVNPQ